MCLTFGPPTFADLLGIDPEADRPVSLILHGGYDMPAAALIDLLDHLIVERHLLDTTLPERERVSRAR